MLASVELWFASMNASISASSMPSLCHNVSSSLYIACICTSRQDLRSSNYTTSVNIITFSVKYGHMNVHLGILGLLHEADCRLDTLDAESLIPGTVQVQTLIRCLLELCNKAAEYEVVGGQCSVIGLCGTGVRGGGCQRVEWGKEGVGCGGRDDGHCCACACMRE